MKALKTREFHLNDMRWYHEPVNQKSICDEIRRICRKEWLSHEDILDDMSHLFAVRGLKVSIPDPHNESKRIPYVIGPVMIYRRWLSLHLQVNAAGEPLHPPRFLSRVRDLHLYTLIKAATTYY